MNDDDDEGAPSGGMMVKRKKKKRTYSLIRGVANLLSYELVHPLARLAAVVGLETGNYERHDDDGWYEVRF